MTSLVVSPWAPEFEAFVQSASRSLFLCSPYVAAVPCDRIAALASDRGEGQSLEVEILTDLSLHNLLSGATDVAALHSFVSVLPGTRVRVLPSLHAKVYVADASRAVVTSANLTSGGLWRNFEFGVLLEDREMVRELLLDLRRYARLGAPVASEQLALLATTTLELRDFQRSAERSIRSRMRREFNRRVRAAEEQVLRVRTSGRSAHAIFADAILHVLRTGPSTTEQIHTAVQAIHPDLCDDSVERIIDGKRFGKKWKHAVRTAQQHLKRRGFAVIDGGAWRLTDAGLDAADHGTPDSSKTG